MDAFLIEPHQQVARLLSYPPTVGVRRDPGQVNAASRELNEEQNIEPLQEQRVDREEIALEDARRLLGGNSAQLASSRIGAGSIPASLRIVQTVLAAIVMPSPTSSPWIRRYPNPGSRARAAPQAHAPRPVSRADRDADADRSSGARQAPCASAAAMYHCHILEHEDRDMMRPFVTMPMELMPFMA